MRFMPPGPGRLAMARGLRRECEAPAEPLFCGSRKASLPPSRHLSVASLKRLGGSLALPRSTNTTGQEARQESRPPLCNP
jgi:hypothetical protein